VASGADRKLRQAACAREHTPQNQFDSSLLQLNKPAEAELP